jgi:hypothetical protein
VVVNELDRLKSKEEREGMEAAFKDATSILT